MGDNGVYELGVLELRLADVDLNLRLSSEITIAPSSESSESDRDGTHTLATTGNIVHGDGVRKPWMVKSHGYQLKVDLALAPELKFEDETFTQQVAAKLKHLEIWQSLEFEVTSIEVCSSENAAASWTLSLDYREHSTPPKTKLHTLAPDVPYHDVKPPPGIHVIKVEGIRVELLLSRPLASGSRQCDSVKSTNVDRKGEDMCLDHELLFNTTDLIHERELSFITKAELGANSSKSPLLSLEEEATMHAVDDISAYLTPPPSQETKEQNHEESGMDSDQHQTSHVSAESVLSCIEAGLRHTMRKLPSRMSRTNVITSKEDFDSLAGIAPALWTPGYHKSVSERAVFLPTISHAIANVSRNSSAILGLRIKAWQLSNRHPHHRGGRSSAESSDRGHGVEEALSMSLWTAMSSALTDGRTAKQSRLFCGSIKADGETNVFENTEDMLDDLAKNSRSSEISDDSEFQDLLDMGGETDNESMSDWFVDDDGNLDGPCCTEASEHRLPNRWNTELQSLLDPELDMFNYGPELRGKFRTGVVETEDGDGGCTGGCHDTGQCFNGSDLDHDSAALQFLETEGQGLNAEDMLLHCLEDIDADTISGRAELDVCAATGDESGVEGQEYVESVDGAELADDEWYEYELLDLM